MWVQAYEELVSVPLAEILISGFWGRDWAGKGGNSGQHQSHADPAITFGQGI